MTIYVDIIFIINLIADFALNFTCTIITDRKISPIRIFLVSLPAAVYGTAAIIYPLLQNMIFAFIYSIFNIFLLFGRSRKEELIRYMLSFYFVCIIAGGGCALFSGSNKSPVSYGEKLFIPANDMRIFFALIFICASSRLIKHIIRQKKTVYTIILKKNNKELRCRAYYDTGNTLTEPLSGKPVIIITKKIYDAISGNILRTINFKTISATEETIDLIKIDELLFCEEKTVLKDIYGGISNFKNDNFDVLLHKNTHP